MVFDGIYVKRDSKDVSALKTTLKALKDRESIALFPEGTRNALKEVRIKELYDKYFTDGDVKRMKLSEFNSNNTRLLNVEETKAKIASLAYIQEELKKLPAKPGVYLMHDEKDEIIYVGKAVVLKNRVRSYFRESTVKSPKIQKMVSQITQVWRYKILIC